MKSLKNKSPLTLLPFEIKFLPAVLAVVCALLANNAKANLYLDVNGTTAGFGIANGGNYNWDTAIWTASSAGTTATTAYPTGAGNFPRFTPPAAANYSITVNGDEHMAGLFSTVSGTTLNINGAGSGFLDVDSGDQGFLLSGTVIINAVIGGSGAVAPENISSGTLKLFGNNTYSGGTAFGYGGTPLVYFNNANSFGTGPLRIISGLGAGTIWGLLGTGGAPITLTNAFSILSSGDGFNFAADANLPVTLTGPWTLGANNLLLKNNGVSSSPLTLSGVISGTGSLQLSANNAGSIILSGANTYSGQTTIAAGGNVAGVGMTVSVASFNSVGAPSASSNLGRPTTAANGTIGIGLTTFTSTLIYTGSGETSDRVINLAGTSGGATLQADGTGALVLTAVNTASVAGAKTLTLQGANTAGNSIGKIVDSSSGATSVAKAQAGTWKLSGANTYTGGTIVNAGTLEISGSTVGIVTVNNTSTLRLDGTSSLSAATPLTIASGATVNLNFSGAQPIIALTIGGTAEPVNTTWGPIGSGAQHEDSHFTGSGTVIVAGAPVITQQPQSITCYPDAVNQTFSVTVVGDPSFTYQWKLGGSDISGANGSSYTISQVEQINAGTYVCWITNTYGYTNTQPATLTVLATNAYVSTITHDNPVSYWRLDETSGTIAHDYVGGNNANYNNVALNQSGYSLTDSDAAVAMAPLNNTTQRGYIQVANPALFSFPPGNPIFTLEAWMNSTNFSLKQRIFSTLNLNSPSGYAFGCPDANTLEFTAGGVADRDVTLSTALVAGQWYHLVCTCDGNVYTFYVNGQQVGTANVTGGANQGTQVALQMGANPAGFNISQNADKGAEQLMGRLDEVAVYSTALSSGVIANHYAVRYADAPLVPAMPVVIPPTNYVSLTTTLQESAAGVGLTYQWYKVPAAAISGATGSSMQLTPLALSDAGYYYVQITDASLNVTNSPTNYVAVLPIPSSAADLNLTNGLVLHLPFDSDYNDVSGRNNNGTSVGASLISGGAVGAKALHYESGITPGVTNYVTLGVRSDLKFGASTDFSVAYWVRQPLSSTYTNLPFFGDALGSTDGITNFNSGFAFAPYETATDAGGWMLGMGSTAHAMTSPSQYTDFPDSNLINDGNWHHLVHVANRGGVVITYLDGKQVDSEAISFIGDISNGNAAVIGQDPTGTYPVVAQADIDDLGVWRARLLTSLEVSGIYLAGATNSVSFASVAIVPVALQIQQVAGQWQITWTGGGTLQASGIVTGGYTNVVPTASSPYVIPTPLADQLFYRLKY